MSDGFSSPIVGGQSKLIRPAVQSPNFQTGSNGWTINKDGSAEFNNVAVRGQINAGSISAGSIGSSTITNSDFQGGTMENTNIVFDSNGGTLLAYASVTNLASFSSSGTFTVPAGITSIRAECWGAGCGGLIGETGGAGGGGGEYSAEYNLTVTPGESLTITVGTGSSGNAPFPQPPGGNTTINRGATALVTAHGGSFNSTTSAGVGGTGSTNSVHFNGGGSPTPNTGTFWGGSGGGASGSASGQGGTGIKNSTGTGGAGGIALSGGGNGGAGGNATSGSTATNGGNGVVPGGGGGSGGQSGVGPEGVGGNGAHGQVKITYVSAQSLVASIASMAGTDSHGNTYPAGISGIVAPVNQLSNTESISFTSLTSFTLNVTFSRSFTNAPTVITNIASGAGVVAHWDSRAIGITNTGFQLFVFAASGATASSWASVPVQWIAMGT